VQGEEAIQTLEIEDLQQRFKIQDWPTVFVCYRLFDGVVS
jgi:hypothetical protein